MTIIETLGGLEQKQRVRLEIEDGTTIEAQVNKPVYMPDENLRIELTPGGSEWESRYQVRASAEDGEWSDPGLREYDSDEEAWIDLGTVVGVESLGQRRTTAGDPDDDPRDHQGDDRADGGGS